MTRAPESRWRWIALGVLALGVTDLAFVSCYRQGVAHFVRESTWTNPSRMPAFDAAVVFFGSLQPTGQLDDATQRRVTDAADLFRQHRVRGVIAVGGARPGRSPTGAQLMSRSLVQQGVSAESVRYDSVSYDSFSNWVQAERIARLEHMHSLVLVSSPSHLMRLAHVVRGSPFTIGFYAGPGEASRGDEGWWTAHRESLAFAALWLLPTDYYATLVRRLRTHSTTAASRVRSWNDV